MQCAALILILLLSGITVTQAWNLGKLDSTDVKDADSMGFGRYMASKRAINGQLRRSSIRWGKRTNDDDVQELIPIPEDFMVMWPAPVQVIESSPMEPKDEKENKPGTVNKKSENSEPEDSMMERVAKGGIRPKLALSSRLWGR